MPLYDSAPAWVKRGAIVDWDFANNRYFGAPIDQRRVPRMQTAVAANGFGTDNIMTGVRPDGRVDLFLGFALRVSSGRGLWSESGDTQYALQSRDLNNASWTKTNMTAVRTQPGADTAATANRGTLLTATAGNATCLQSITLASGAFCVGAWVRRSVGTGRIDMTMDGGTTWVEITSSINSSGYTRVQIPTQTLANPNVGFRIVTSGDAIIVDFFQAVDRSFLPTPIITTTATVTRTSERPAINHEGATTSFNQGEDLIRRLLVNSPASIFVEYAGFGYDGTGSNVNVAGGTGITRLENGVMGVAATYGNVSGTDAVTSNVGNSSTSSAYVFNRAVATISGNGCKVSLNGGAIASGTATISFVTPPASVYDHFVFGGNGDGLRTLNGCFRRISLWRRGLTDAELVGFSSWSAAETTTG